MAVVFVIFSTSDDVLLNDNPGVCSIRMTGARVHIDWESRQRLDIETETETYDRDKEPYQWDHFVF